MHAALLVSGSLAAVGAAISFAARARRPPARAARPQLCATSN
jgi:hypothetical protein